MLNLSKLSNLSIRVLRSNLDREIPMVVAFRNESFLIELFEDTFILLKQREVYPLGVYSVDRGLVETSKNIEVIFFFNKLTKITYDFLVINGIPFISEDGFIFIPKYNLNIHKGSFKQEKENIKIINNLKMPAYCQEIILFFIYNNCSPNSLEDISIKLSLNKDLILKGLNTLKELNLIFSYKTNNLEIFDPLCNKKELFLKSLENLGSPIKSTIIVPKRLITKDYPLSSFTAIQNYSSLTRSNEDYYAIKSLSTLKNSRVSCMYNFNEYCFLEEWWYDPNKFKFGNFVDPISLFLILKEEAKVDSRVKIALNELLDKVFQEENNCL